MLLTYPPYPQGHHSALGYLLTPPRIYLSSSAAMRAASDSDASLGSGAAPRPRAPRARARARPRCLEEFLDGERIFLDAECVRKERVKVGLLHRRVKLQLRRIGHRTAARRRSAESSDTAQF